MKIRWLLSIVAIAMVVLMLGCSKDDDNNVNLSPTVLSTDPANNATDVVLNKIVTVSFSEGMNYMTLTSETFTISQGTTPVAGTVSYSGTTASFEPTAVLTSNTLYTATVTNGAENSSGTALEGDYVWTFTTSAETTLAPLVVTTNPETDATDVVLNTIVTATFSEPMEASTINASSFTVKAGDVAIDGTVSYSGTIATFTPTNSLSAGTVYNAMLSTEAENLAGIALAGNIVWSFATGDASDEVAPTVTTTNPLNDAIEVERNITVEATFSEEMDPLTVNASTFTLMDGTNEVSGVVEYAGTMATFTPTNSLLAETVYTAKITTEATDLAGNAIAVNKEWSFTTGGSVTGQAVVDLGTAGNYVILAKTAITNNPTSHITGDLGLSPAATSYITGFALTAYTGYAESAQVTGQIFASDMADPTPINLTTAVENMMTAYNDAAGRPTPDFLELGTGNIGGKTLEPGLYKWTSTVTLPTDVTISGGAEDVWIFQISGDLTMSAGVNIILEGEAQAKNIFWQVSGEATFSATAHFEGIILSSTGITFQTGASLNGRALAQTAVVLDGNTIIEK
ncbi:MAG: ice-binding family protein [Bacteroidales bacterium]